MERSFARRASGRRSPDFAPRSFGMAGLFGISGRTAVHGSLITLRTAGAEQFIETPLERVAALVAACPGTRQLHEAGTKILGRLAAPQAFFRLPARLIDRFQFGNQGVQRARYRERSLACRYQGG